MSRPCSTEIGRLADQLERSFHGGAWHGPATREVLSGIAATTATQRPGESPHSIRALARHIAFWMSAAHLRIVEHRDVDDRQDWPEEESLTEAAWKKEIAQLEMAYEKLHSALLNLDDVCLDDAVPGADPTVRGLLLGTLQHNAYHTGQIVQIARELSK